MSKTILFVLSLYLMVGEPASVAGELLGSVDTLGMRGAAGALELIAHAAVALLAVIAGWSVRTRRPGAAALAQLALTASALRIVQSLYWSVLPHQTMPGQKGPIAAAAVVTATAWIAYLRRSEYVRASFT
jgi:hypothetical protein